MTLWVCARVLLLLGVRACARVGRVCVGVYVCARVCVCVCVAFLVDLME